MIHSGATRLEAWVYKSVFVDVSRIPAWNAFDFLLLHMAMTFLLGCLERSFGCGTAVE